MSAGMAGDVLWVFIEAAAQTRYIQKQLVPSIQPRQEQVGLSRLTAPSLTQPPPYGPQQPERRLCQNCVTHKDWNKMEDLVPKGIYAHCGGGADVSCCFWWAGRSLNLWHLVRFLIGKHDVQKGVKMLRFYFVLEFRGQNCYIIFLYFVFPKTPLKNILIFCLNLRIQILKSRRKKI